MWINKKCAWYFQWLKAERKIKVKSLKEAHFSFSFFFLPETPAWFSQCRSEVTNCRFPDWYWNHLHLPSRPLQKKTARFKMKAGSRDAFLLICHALTAQCAAACCRLWAMNGALMHRHGSSFTSEFIRATRAASLRASAWLSHTCRQRDRGMQGGDGKGRKLPSNVQMSCVWSWSWTNHTQSSLSVISHLIKATGSKLETAARLKTFESSNHMSSLSWGWGLGPLFEPQRAPSHKLGHLKNAFVLN